MTAAQKPEAQAAAYLHHLRVVGVVPDEFDQALSFDPDEYPLSDTGAFVGLSVEPLFTRATLDAAVAEAVAAERELWQADAERYRWLEKITYQKTAYDVFGNGAHWSIGFHSKDSNESFSAAIDAAIRRTTQDTPT